MSCSSAPDVHVAAAQDPRGLRGRPPRRAGPARRCRSAGSGGSASRRTGSRRGRSGSRRLADRQRPVLVGMDVPVAVLGDVRGDRAAQLVPAQALVLVGEDVGAVAPQSLGQVDVGLALAEQPERLHVVGPHVATDVLVDRVAASSRRRRRASAAGSRTSGGGRRRAASRPAARAGSAEVADRVAQRHDELADRVRPERLRDPVEAERISRCRCCGTP